MAQRKPDPALTAFIAEELSRPTLAEATAFAAHLGQRHGVAAVLFYGSCLQRGTTEGVLDFYVLTDEPGVWTGNHLLEKAGRVLPPNVYVEEFDGLKAKVAVVRIEDFRARCSLSTLDTTFWARFCQRCALLWSRDATTRRDAVAAVATAVETAAVWAARLTPGAEENAAWAGLFTRTYTVEIRPERKGRGDAIVATDADRFAALWPLTAPARTAARPMGWGAWRARWWAGKALHIGRLAKGAFTYEGGVRYLFWKIRRHRRK